MPKKDKIFLDLNNQYDKFYKNIVNNIFKDDMIIIMKKQNFVEIIKKLKKFLIQILPNITNK